MHPNGVPGLLIKWRELFVTLLIFYVVYVQLLMLNVSPLD